MLIEEMTLTALQIKRLADRRERMSFSDMYNLVLRIEEWRDILSDTTVFDPGKVVKFPPKLRIILGYDANEPTTQNGIVFIEHPDGKIDRCGVLEMKRGFEKNNAE